MFTTLSIHFYSEIDTSKQVAPLGFLIQGLGTDSILNASTLLNIGIPLDALHEETKYVVSYTSEASDLEILKLNSNNTFSSLDGTQTRIVKKIEKMLYDFGTFEDQRICIFQQDSFYYFRIPTIDTLKITHKNALEFISAECGCLNTFEIINAEFMHNKIGSIYIHNPNINTQSNEKHLQIYLENY